MMELMVFGGVALIFLLLAQAMYTLEQWIAGIGILLFLSAIIIWVFLESRKSEPTEPTKVGKSSIRKTTKSMQVATEKKSSPQVDSIHVLRGGAFVGNRFRFKVKVANLSQYTITDVKVQLVSYPRDALKFDADDDDVYYAKIEPGGFRSPTFDFIPTQDCVKGDVVAGVTYIDMKGNAQSRITKPLEIRAVCDLLIPEEISPDDFKLTIKELRSGELAVSVDEWTPEEMFEKAQLILRDTNFHDVSSKMDRDDNVISAKVEGWARGKYTDKGVGVQLFISGMSGETGACCTIRVSGEDSALVLPAIEDLRNRLITWLCPKCRSTLSITLVNQIKKGNVVECPYCGVTIDR